jgi:hypothetical protein
VLGRQLQLLSGKLWYDASNELMKQLWCEHPSSLWCEEAKSMPHGVFRLCHDYQQAGPPMTSAGAAVVVPALYKR